MVPILSPQALMVPILASQALMMLPMAHFQLCSPFPSSPAPRTSSLLNFMGQITTISPPSCQAAAAELLFNRSSILISGSRPFKLKRFAGMRSLKMLATSEEKSTTESPIESEKAVSAASDKKAEAREAAEKGKVTAIVTGAIAVLLGVGYLILVQLLDSRGVILVPPPPEAFDP